MPTYRNYKRMTSSRRKQLRGASMEGQTIMSCPSKIFLETYTTKSGQEKNRYRKDPKSKPVKDIIHTKN